jgi:hypothetical protein
MLKLINLDDTFIGLHGKMGGFTIYTEIDVGEEDGELEIIYHVPNPRKEDEEDNLDKQSWHINKIHILE